MERKNGMVELNMGRKSEIVKTKGLHDLSNKELYQEFLSRKSGNFEEGMFDDLYQEILSRKQKINK